MTKIVKNILSACLLATFLPLATISPIVAQSLDEEHNLQQYESEFRLAPDDDSRWQIVQIEDWEKTVRLLAGSANSNLERLSSWNASYNLVTGSDLTRLAKSSSVANKYGYIFPSYVVSKQKYSFYRDNENDSSYISLVRQGDLSFFDSLYEKYDYDNQNSNESVPMVSVKSNLKAIITPDRLLLYEYDHDSYRPEGLTKLGYEEFGKKCVVLPSNSREIGHSGTIFDPQFFFYQQVNKKYKYKYWDFVDRVFPLLFQAYLDKTDDTIKQRIIIHKCTVDGIEWVRIKYTPKNEENPIKTYYFNSESNYNLVAYRSILDEVPLSVIMFEYTEIDGVLIPKRFLYEYSNLLDYKEGGKKGFRYFDLINAEVNKPIPEEQFIMDALGLDDDAVVYDKTEGNYYAYEKGKKISKPIARFDDLPNGIKTRAASTPLWRSPIRMTALCLGVCLLVFGVIYKVRRKRASS